MDVDNGHGKVNVNGQCREDNSIALTCALMNMNYEASINYDEQSGATPATVTKS